MKEKISDTLQKRLDLISRFLHHTVEPFDEWDYNGEELVILLNNKIIEIYDNSDLKEMIFGFDN